MSEEKKSSCTCIVGSSGSGKTTLVKRLTAGRKTYVINSEGEYNESDKEEISWEDASDQKIENCNLVFEDLIGVRAKETKLIKRFVHFLLRRKNIKLFLLAHEIHNTGLFSLVNNMDQIYVTSGRKSDKIIKDLKRLVKFEPPEPPNFGELEHHYLRIDLAQEKSQLLNSNFEEAIASSNQDLAQKRASVLGIANCLPEAEILMKLFDLIFSAVDHAILCPDSLCVDLTSKKPGGKNSKVHIVDFLAALRSKARPSKDVRRLKKYIDNKKAAIPQLLILNDFLLKN